MAIRIDKLLWFLRFTQTRSIAQAMVGAGHIRLNGRRIDRAHQGVGVGDVLVLPLSAGVCVVQVLAVPERRGPPSAAQTCYRVLDEARPNPLAATSIATGAERDLQP
ncbi:MAG: RNA-binding S4 domain-containing protein [Novosphingobium sp.]